MDPEGIEPSAAGFSDRGSTKPGPSTKKTPSLTQRRRFVFSLGFGRASLYRDRSLRRRGKHVFFNANPQANPIDYLLKLFLHFQYGEHKESSQ